MQLATVLHKVREEVINMCLTTMYRHNQFLQLIPQAKLTGSPLQRGEIRKALNCLIQCWAYYEQYSNKEVVYATTSSK